MNPGFVGGLAVSPDGRVALRRPGLRRGGRRASTSRRAPSCARRELPAEAYTAVLAPGRARASTSRVWGGARVAVLDPRTLAPLAEIPVGEHPNAMAFSKDGARLFVACANTNAVWVVDLATRQAVEQIGVALSPKAPPGSTPNALALSPDGAHPARRQRRQQHGRGRGRDAPRREPLPGLHPHRLVPDRASPSTATGENILVLSGKGLPPAANPRGPQPVAPRATRSTSAACLNGALSDRAACRTRRRSRR